MVVGDWFGIGWGEQKKGEMARSKKKRGKTSKVGQGK